MSKKRNIKIGIITICIAFIFMIVALLLFSKNQDISMKMKDKIAQVNNLVISSATKEELATAINVDDINSLSIMTGEDSYMRLLPSKNKIDEYNLQKYQKEQDSLATIVEKSIKDNFVFELEKKTAKINDATVYYGVLKAFYQMTYLQDLQELQRVLFEEYKLSNGITDEEVEQYKAKVVAMKILNEKLNQYKNNDQYCGAAVYQYEDEESTSMSLLSYLNLLQGINFHNEDVEELENTREERITKYIEEAKENNLIDTSNVLNIK